MIAIIFRGVHCEFPGKCLYKNSREHTKMAKYFWHPSTAMPIPYLASFKSLSLKSW